MNPLKKLVGQTAIYGLSSVVGRLANYLLVPLYTRVFLPEEYGIVIEMYAYVAFLVVVLTYGLETAFFRFVSIEKDSKIVYSTALISLITSSIFFIALMFFSSISIANSLGAGIESIYIKWFSIIIGIDAVTAIAFAKLRYEEKAIRFSIIKLLSIFLNICLNLYFILIKGLISIEFIFISNLITSIFILLCLLPQFLNIKYTFDKVLWKRMMFYALPLLVAGLAGIINETVDRVLLKQLLTNKASALYELGLYGAFYKISIIMLLFIQTFRYAAEPFFFAQYNPNSDRKIYADVMNYFSVFMMTIFLVVTIFYDFIIGFLGPNFHDERGFAVVSILLMANVFLGIFFNLSIWYKLTEKTIFGAYLSIFGAIITLVLNIFLIPKIGFLGSAWATLICYFSMALASYILGKKHFPVPYRLGKMFLYISCTLAIYFSVYHNYFNLLINTVFLSGFIIFVYYLEKPIKS